MSQLCLVVALLLQLLGVWDCAGASAIQGALKQVLESIAVTKYLPLCWCSAKSPDLAPVVPDPSMLTSQMGVVC